MRVLISGAGVAGPTLAYWLLRHGGFEVTLVESAPALRTGGYVIDFWGTGYEIAERMGLLPDILASGYNVREVRMVDGRGRRVGGMPVDAFRRATNGRYVSVPRSALAGAIYASIAGRVESIFGDRITALEERATSLAVTFAHASPREFDLVVGADGVHSVVRELALGVDAPPQTYLGMQFAAFELPGYRPRDDDAYVMHNEVGQQSDRFTLRGDRTLFLFIMAHPSPDAPPDLEAQKALLRRRFGNSGWECPQILAQLDQAENFYFDRVSQIRLPRWSKGRTVLVGDAAFAPSFLAGQGSALAMLGAYVLAGELKRAGADLSQAFARYNERLGDLMASKQRAAVRFASNFAPPSKVSVFLQNHLASALALPLIPELFFGRLLKDQIELPTY